MLPPTANHAKRYIRQLFEGRMVYALEGPEGWIIVRGSVPPLPPLILGFPRRTEDEAWITVALSQDWDESLLMSMETETGIQ